MRICTLILLVSPFLSNIAGSKAIADGEIPTPSVDRIDYTHPEKYTDISPAFGDVAAIRKIGETLRSSTQKRSIAAILKWMGKNLRYDANVPDGVRNFDAIVTSLMTKVPIPSHCRSRRIGNVGSSKPVHILAISI
jgi:hypothetical protein